MNSKQRKDAARAAIALAESHLGKGAMDSSARLCFSDARFLLKAGDFTSARERAAKSIAYSVGILHPDYAKAGAL